MSPVSAMPEQSSAQMAMWSSKQDVDAGALT